MEKSIILSVLSDIAKWGWDNRENIVWVCGTIGGAWITIPKINKGFIKPISLFFKDAGLVKQKIFDTNEMVTDFGNRLSAMIDISDMAILEFDDEGHCIRANNSVCNMFGATRDRMLGGGWINYLENPREEWKAWFSIIKNNTETSREIAILVGQRKGDKIFARYDAYMKRDSKGEVTNITAKFFKI